LLTVNENQRKPAGFDQVKTPFIPERFFKEYQCGDTKTRARETKTVFIDVETGRYHCFFFPKLYKKR
jgi:hypothetical protein